MTASTVCRPTARRADKNAVSVPATTTAAPDAPRRSPRQQQVHGPVEALRVDDLDEHDADGEAEAEAEHGADAGPDRAFGGDDGEDLAPRQAEVDEQAELLAPRQHLRREARRDAEQADRDRHRLQPVGDGEAAVEDAQRRGADLARRRELEQRRVVAARGGDAAQLVLDLRRARAGREPEREVVDALVAAEAAPVGARRSRSRRTGARSRARRRARRPSRDGRRAAAATASSRARRRTGRPSLR